MFFLRHQQNLEYEAFPPDQHSSGGPMAGRGSVTGRPKVRTKSPGREDSDDDESYFESEDDEPADAPQGNDSRSTAGSASQDSPETSGAHAVLEGTAPAASAAETAAEEEKQGTLGGLLGSYNDEEEEPSADAAVTD